MAIGYACLTVGVEGTKYKSCRKENAGEENLKDIIESNLSSLDRMLDYNIKNGIKLLRISSDIIPFGSHPANKLKWWEIYEEKLFALGEKAKHGGQRLSMHPGQYTVLNSKQKEVVEKAVCDLSYHTRFLDALNLDGSNKMILHIGGAYGNKEEALERFAKNYVKLEQNIKDRLVIENDDKIFNIDEVLSLGNSLHIPVVYDNLHNRINSCREKSDKYWIEEAKKTWTKKDGRQKTHYSQQAEGKKAGSHSASINVREFLKYYEEVNGEQIDIMLEVKDKNLSAIKCINTVEKRRFVELEKEWARYKYLILEHEPSIYKEIRELLKDKRRYPVLEFYDLVDSALAKEVTAGHAVNAAQHVWGYFSEDESEKTKEKVKNQINKIKEGGSSRSLKKFLWDLAEKNKEEYLLQSLYFKDIL